MAGSKSLPTTPVPDHVPPAGLPTNNVDGSPGQNGPRAFPDKSNTYMSKSTGVPGQLFTFVSITSTAFGYSPEVPPQSTVIEFVPWPVCKAPPPPVIVH